MIGTGMQGIDRAAIGAGSGNPDTLYVAPLGIVALGLTVAAFPPARGSTARSGKFALTGVSPSRAREDQLTLWQICHKVT